MGMNYYVNINVCSHCNKPDYQLHLGKRSPGWTFHFRAHEGIKSYEDWFNFISDLNGQIVDECGTLLTLEEFNDIVLSSRNNKVNHVDYVNDPFQNPDYEFDFEYRKKCWKDPEGNAFSDWEFV